MEDLKGKTGNCPKMGDDTDPSFWKEARRLQEEVARFGAGQGPVDSSVIQTVGGADVSYEGDNACACFVVMECRSLREQFRAAATSKVRVPYVPGYFAFREIPALLAALRLVYAPPDLVFVHGHGYAHPRRAGIATHLGILLGVPTIGVAGNLFPPWKQKTPLIFPGQLLLSRWVERLSGQWSGPAGERPPSSSLRDSGQLSPKQSPSSCIARRTTGFRNLFIWLTGVQVVSGKRYTVV